MKRILILAISALAVLALPGSAFAGRSHLVKMYKVEQHIDLDGQDETYTLTCPNTDLAVDGMWRVDDVSQDNEYEYDGPGGSWSNPVSDPLDHADWDVLRSVRPVEVYSTDDSSYDFEFTPLSGGDVQMKLWIICVGRKSETIGGHYVTWDIVDPQAGPADTTVAVAGPVNAANPCDTGEIVVQPSFKVGGGDADLVASRPTNSNDTSWQWYWDNVQTGFTADHHVRCLSLRSSGFSGSGTTHRHRLIKQWATKDAPSNGKFKQSSVSEVQRVCGEHYKGVIGGWDWRGNTPAGFAYGGSYYMHFLGMDPRIKTRAFKFINRSPSDQQVLDGSAKEGLFLVCFKDKTS